MLPKQKSYSKDMRYIIRALKYFIHISVLLAIVVAILFALNIVEGGINDVFRNGWDSIWMLALMFLGLSAFYPLLGYAHYTASVAGSLEERKAEICSYMQEKGYVLSKEDGDCLKFRLTSFGKRLMRDFEDTVSVRSVFGGFEFEGYRKDIIPLIHGFEERCGEKVMEQ